LVRPFSFLAVPCTDSSGCVGRVGKQGLRQRCARGLEEDLPAVVDELYSEGGGEQRAEERESVGSGLKGHLEARGGSRV